MPLRSLPAGDLAQSIAAKQRTSTIFDDTAPVRRPSASGTDQQTQHFVRNLRTHTPRSPSVSRSTSSLAGQPHGRAERNYMKATSSSRRRSRNAGLEEDGMGSERPHQIPAPSNYSPAASRRRGQSPCRTLVPRVATLPLHTTTRVASVRHAPPLPPCRAPSVSRGLQLQQPLSTISNGGLRQHEGSLAGVSTNSWQLENGHRSSLPIPRQQQKQQQQQQQQQQKIQGCLSSSWTVRDPLTSAGNAHADMVEADDGSLQLDASDQQELSQLTASFERTGLCCYTETSSQTNTACVPCCGSTAAPLQGSTESQSHLPEIPKGLIESLTMVKRHQHMQGPSTLTGQAIGQHQHQQSPQPEPLQQQHHPRQQEPQQQQPAQQSEQQQVVPRPWPWPPQPQEPSTGGISIRRVETLGCMSSAPQSEKRPGVAVSAFGMAAAPSECRAYEGFWKLAGSLKSCLRFIVVLIVCLFRLLNTSYDTWSASQFRKAFEEVLAGPAYRGGSADTSKLQSGLRRISMGSTAQQQRPQQQKQQHQSQPRYSTRNSTNAHSSVGGVQQREPDTGRATHARTGGLPFAKACKGTAGETLGFHRPALKVISLIVAVASLLCWLFITTAPKEEFVDFDFM
ncbi:uncharacterized protein EMH_0028580 [Eimeria mitis]|uniref:Uncharacterized protein n=1 Tax=Eimeria mitis TaxID=44415 RepID=U6K079_9EIME|nr:uncharacterized protein EMH_0028580 [Eimeria mitis]CDJ30361.1 hypothetical protein, conserved [Eimeria mitis]